MKIQHLVLSLVGVLCLISGLGLALKYNHLSVEVDQWRKLAFELHSISAQTAASRWSEESWQNIRPQDLRNATNPCYASSYLGRSVAWQRGCYAGRPVSAYMIHPVFVNEADSVVVVRN